MLSPKGKKSVIVIRLGWPMKEYVLGRGLFDNFQITPHWLAVIRKIGGTDI